MEALQIITQALNVANQKGAYTLQESATIFSALNQVTNLLNSSLETEKAVKTTEKEK